MSSKKSLLYIRKDNGSGFLVDVKLATAIITNEGLLRIINENREYMNEFWMYGDSADALVLEDEEVEMTLDLLDPYDLRTGESDEEYEPSDWWYFPEYDDF